MSSELHSFFQAILIWYAANGVSFVLITELKKNRASGFFADDRMRHAAPIIFLIIIHLFIPGMIIGMIFKALKPRQ